MSFPAAIAAAWLLAATVPAVADTVTLQGSTVVNSRLIEPYRALIEERAKARLSIIANKSIHGLIALLEGRVDLAMISSTLEGEINAVRRVRTDLPVERLKSFEIARTRIAFAVHPDNPVRRATLDQMRKVLSGEIRSWRELRGPDGPISVITVQPGGGVPTTVRSQLLAGRTFAAARLVEVESPRHVVRIVEQEPAALGIIQLGLLNGLVRELATETPIEQQLNLVTLDEPDARLRAVIEAMRWVAAERLF